MAEEADSEQPRDDNARKKAPDENSTIQIPQLLLTTATIMSQGRCDSNSDSDGSNISISVTDNEQVTAGSSSMSENLQASQVHIEVTTSLKDAPVISRPRLETVAVLPEPRRISLSPHDHQSPLPSRETQDQSPSLSVSTHSSPPTMIFSEVTAGEDSNGMIMSSSLSGRHFEPINIDTMDHGDDATYTLPDSSPEMVVYDTGSKSSNRLYKCRFCSFTATTYTQLQLHMPRHGGVKALKCPLCDYSTNDKSNFRRHRRLHIGSNPVSVLKCEKCSYSTILPRKFREHYSQVHNEQLGTNYQYQTSPYRHQGYDSSQYRMGHVEISPAPSQSTISSSNMSATNALHSLLRGIHSTPVHYGHVPTHGQPIAGQCISQYPGYPTPVRRSSEENHMASNYLRSIVSSIMNNPQPAQPLPAASSTISSSGYYMAADPNQPHLPISRSPPAHMPAVQPLHGHQVKVKVEPPERPDTPEVPDVSSTAPPPRHHVHLIDRNRQAEVQGFSRNYSEVRDNSMIMECNEATTSAEVNRSHSVDSGPSFHRGEAANADGSSIENQVNTTVKLETSNVGIQCSFPIIKSESCVVGSSDRVFATNCVERGVQCEIMTSVRCINQRTQSLTSESDFNQEQQGFSLAENRCNHCGITFDDEVLYTIHIGCHSHTDPFVCNVCGKHCGNKYGFYSHIMRGHHY